MGPWCAQQVGLGGWLGMVAFWLVIVALAIWVVTKLFPRQQGGGALAALDARLARGELDTETYRRIREELERPGVSDPLLPGQRSGG
jgi:uncharacterized membrane protein